MSMEKTLKEILDEILDEVEKELDEATATGNVAGYQTPYAFGNNRKKDKKKEKETATQAGYTLAESVNEGISVFDERHFGKKGIIIMIDDNGKKVSAIFKDKKNADKFNRNKPSDIKKLLQLAKKTKFPKAIDESLNEAKVKRPVNRWLELKNDETMHPHKKMAMGLKELKYQLRETEKFFNWYNKIKTMNELDSQNYWKRTNRHIYTIKEKLINIAKTIQEIEK